MQVQVHSSNGIAGTDGLERWAQAFLAECLARFSDEISSVQVQLSDENQSTKGGVDKKCTLEARLNGHAPVVAHNLAPDQNLAIRGAADKLLSALDRALGKLDRHDHRQRDSIRRDADITSG